MKKVFDIIDELPEFKKDFKRLLKKYKTLQEDLDIFISVQLKLFHKLNIDNHGIVQVSDLNIDCPLIFKSRKFACRSLKGKGAKSGIRIIYAYYQDIDKIEFVEIYYKGNKENEDKDRIGKYYK